MDIKAVIDRFEGNKAVLLIGEEEVGVVWPRKVLPDANEGDILAINISVDVEATREAQAEIQKLFDSVVSKDNNDDA